MGRVYVARSRFPDDEELEGPAFARVNHGGTFFFLRPALLELCRDTGELIDPQTSTFFCGDALDALGDFVATGRESALHQPWEWEQRVGESLPSGEPRLVRTTRNEVLEFLDQLAQAVATAHGKGEGVLFWGE